MPRFHSKQLQNKSPISWRSKNFPLEHSLQRRRGITQPGLHSWPTSYPVLSKRFLSGRTFHFPCLMFTLTPALSSKQSKQLFLQQGCSCRVSLTEAPWLWTLFCPPWLVIVSPPTRTVGNPFSLPFHILHQDDTQLRGSCFINRIDHCSY